MSNRSPIPRPSLLGPALLGPALLALALLASCAGAPRLGPPNAEPETEPEALSSATSPSPALLRLAQSEIREYRGERLGSLLDFRENSILGPQYLDRESYRLHVGGRVERPLELSYAELLSLPRVEKRVVLHCVEGWSVDILWEGFELTRLLELAGAEAGASTLVFRAADGYATSLPLDFARERRLILALKMNGVELPPERGFPLQLVAEDRWGYKWIKWIGSIELGDAEIRGYWEERGYSAEGLLERGPREPALEPGEMRAE